MLKSNFSFSMCTRFDEKMQIVEKNFLSCDCVRYTIVDDNFWNTTFDEKLQNFFLIRKIEILDLTTKCKICKLRKFPKNKKSKTHHFKTHFHKNRKVEKNGKNRVERRTFLAQPSRINDAFPEEADAEKTINCVIVRGILGVFDRGKWQFFGWRKQEKRRENQSFLLRKNQKWEKNSLENFLRN